MLRNETRVEESPDQSALTRRYTEEALRFIEEHREQPFFLYLAHSMPHLPIAVSEKFRGVSGYGLYGDVIAEIDWSVGEILDQLRRLGLEHRTLVLFTTDNGPVVWEGEDRGWVWTPEDDGRGTRGQIPYRSGSAGPLRGHKNRTWEGGMRVPFIAWWPGQIPGGQLCSEMATVMDFLPTIARLAEATLPAERRIDGYDISPLLLGRPGAESPYVAFYYYREDRLQAVRSGRWKLHLYRPPDDPEFPDRRDPLLYDLQEDFGETRNLAAEYPHIVAQLQALAEAARRELGDAVTGHPGSQLRPVGRLTRGGAGGGSAGPIGRH